MRELFLCHSTDMNPTSKATTKHYVDRTLAK